MAARSSEVATPDAPEESDDQESPSVSSRLRASPARPLHPAELGAVRAWATHELLGCGGGGRAPPLGPRPRRGEFFACFRGGGAPPPPFGPGPSPPFPCSRPPFFLRLRGVS